MHASAIKDTRVRDLKGFSAIVVEDCFEVHYTQSKDYRVYIDTLDGSILPRTVTTVINDTLFISYSHNRVEHVRILVSSPSLTYINISGNSNFIAESNIKSEYAALFVSGTSKLALKSLTTTFVHINKSGAGSFRMTGALNCDSLIAEAEGVEGVTLHDIRSTIANISVSGTCGCTLDGTVNVNSFVATMNGAGSITIDGDINARQNVWLEMIGAGSVKAKGHVTGELLNVRLKGVGSVTASDIDVTRADVVLKGIGTVTLGGKAEMINKDVAGFGQVKVDNLVVPETSK